MKKVNLALDFFFLLPYIEKNLKALTNFKVKSIKALKINDP